MSVLLKYGHPNRGFKREGTPLPALEAMSAPSLAQLRIGACKRVSTVVNPKYGDGGDNVRFGSLGEDSDEEAPYPGRGSLSNEPQDNPGYNPFASLSEDRMRQDAENPPKFRGAAVLSNPNEEQYRIRLYQERNPAMFEGPIQNMQRPASHGKMGIHVHRMPLPIRSDALTMMELKDAFSRDYDSWASTALPNSDSHEADGLTFMFDRSYHVRVVRQNANAWECMLDMRDWQYDPRESKSVMLKWLDDLEYGKRLDDAQPPFDGGGTQLSQWSSDSDGASD